jgi:serine/threonine protein kinase
MTRHHHNGDTRRVQAPRVKLSLPRAPQPYTPLQPGRTMRDGTYRIVRPLGKGGMGAIYLVEDLGAFGRQRIIKEMLHYFDPADPMATQRAQQLFEAEGRTLAQLRHPGIPHITTYFTEEDRNYIVMEYVEGNDLRQGLTHEDDEGNKVRGQPYAVADVLRWAIQLCDVLIYLAQQEPPVIHHDIKPANIIVDQNTGEARLTDFGTAKARLVARPGGGLGVQKSSVYGTEGYAAPEMYEGESSPLSDVYSLAATLYHLLTDDDPCQHPLDFPRLKKLDPALRATLRATLQADPQERPDAQTFRQALSEIRAALHGEARAPFVFPDGQRVHTPDELAQLCDEQWDAAKKLLYSGDFERWLRQSLFRADLADKATTAVKANKDRDEGLEEFLHALNPRLRYPALRVRPRTLRFGRIMPGDEAQRSLRIHNRSRRGPLKGTITQDPLVLWLSAARRFDGEGDVTVTVKTGDLPQGTKLRTTLKLKTAYEEKTIAVRAKAAFPWPRLLGQIGLPMLVGATAGGYLAFLGMSAPLDPATFAGLGVVALPLAWLCARRAQAPRKGKGVRLLLWALLFALLLALANWGCYSLWSLVRQTDPFGGWALPTGAGAIVGLAVGVARVLDRPGRRLIAWLCAALILLGSLSRCAWTAYQAAERPSLDTPSHVPGQAPTAPASPTPAGEISIGAEVMVVTDGSRLNVRSAPRTDAEIVTKVEPGTRLEVLDGPHAAGGYTWWRVELPDGTIGWAAEDWLRPVQ